MLNGGKWVFGVIATATGSKVSRLGARVSLSRTAALCLGCDCVRRRRLGLCGLLPATTVERRAAAGDHDRGLGYCMSSGLDRFMTLLGGYNLTSPRAGPLRSLHLALRRSGVWRFQQQRSGSFLFSFRSTPWPLRTSPLVSNRIASLSRRRGGIDCFFPGARREVSTAGQGKVDGTATAREDAGKKGEKSYQGSPWKYVAPWSGGGKLSCSIVRYGRFASCGWNPGRLDGHSLRL